MKKFLLFGFILLLGSKAYSAQDREGSARPSLWRSSSTCVAETHVVMSTYAVHLHGVRVASATVNSLNSGVFFMNARLRPTSANFAAFSTGNFVLTDVPSAVAVSDDGTKFLDVAYSSGVVVNKIGGACVEIYWDFLYNTYDQFYPWRP